jgi:RNA recognition motif-containing protein
MSLFVGNISRLASVQELEDAFGKHGAADIKHKGSYAFVDFPTEKEAGEAKEKLHKTDMHG